MMRLAVVTTYFPHRDHPNRGHTAYQTLRRLTDRMHIKVFCPMAVYPKWLEPRAFLYTRADVNYAPPGVSVDYLEYSAIPVATRPINGLMCSRSVFDGVRRFAPDVLLNYTLYPEGFAAVAIGKKLGVPVVLGAIGSDVRRIPDRITGWLTRRAVRDADFVMAVSEDLRRLVIQMGARPERTRAVLNGVDASLFRYQDRTLARSELCVPADSPMILFVGSVTEAKGIRDLVEAVIQLRPRHPKIRLVCVGDGTCRAELVASTSEAGLGETILFPGQCPPEQVARWMAAADVFCLPSYSEGCPNVVIGARPRAPGVDNSRWDTRAG